MQLNFVWEMVAELFPNSYDQIFGAAHFSFHEGHIKIQVLMIQRFDDMFLDDQTEFLYVKQKPGARIRNALYGNKQIIVVTMPVFVSAGAKDLIIFFFAPGRIVQFMRRIKMFHSRQVNHIKK